MEIVTPRTREEILQEIVDLSDTKDRINFLLGEKIIQLVEHDNNPTTAKGDAASVLKCSRRFVDQLTSVFQTFGWEFFYPDVPWSMYRTCMGTDRPIYWLEQALAHDWSIRQLRIEYRKAKGEVLDEDQAGGAIIKATGEVIVSPGLITIRSENISTEKDRYKIGEKYKIDIR